MQGVVESLQKVTDRNVVHAMSSVIQTTNLSRNFGEHHAVDGVEFEVNEGEMFGIVGPDGAGKTTLIRMMCGILAPSSGTAIVLGEDILKNPDRVKAQIGYLSQRFSLYGDLSVDENIEFFAEINGVYDLSQAGGTPGIHAAHAVPRPPRRKTLRRNEAKTRPRLHAHPHAQDYLSRRTDHGGRPRFPPRFLEDFAKSPCAWDHDRDEHSVPRRSGAMHARRAHEQWKDAERRHTCAREGVDARSGSGNRL
jgi:ABC-type sugar transport system ATPase subunit